MRHTLLALTLTFSAAILPAHGGEAGKVIFKLADKLTGDDPLDKTFKKSYCKIHEVNLPAGKFVRIDLVSKDFNAYLRLQNAAGKVLVQDDNSGGSTNARIVFKAPEGATFRLVATCPSAGKTGDYVLTVTEATLKDRRDLLTAQASKLASPKLDASFRAGLLRDLRDYVGEKADKLDLDDAQLTLKVCQAMERAMPKEGAAIYEGFIALLAKSPKTTASQSKWMEASVRRLRLPGNDMVVKGINMKGEEIDWKSYRGKVVLVDFWATWCGPCRAELPNVRKMYDMYHRRGFEVVGVSTDANRAALEKFIDKEKLPWICLHENNGKAGHRLSSYYGVNFIPLAILVGRDGKVISTRARGPELVRLLKEHIGPAQ